MAASVRPGNAASRAVGAVAAGSDQPGRKLQDTVTLSPFQVTANSNVGYGAQSAMSSSRLNTRYIDIPQSVNVLTAQFLQDTFSFESRQMLEYASGVAPRANYHDLSYSIRGFQTTAVYIDGFRTSATTFRDTALYDRVEIVKGPASAAIGRGEPGGLINFATKQPLWTDKTSVNLTIGTDELARADVDTMGVLSPAIAYRIVGYYNSNNTTRDCQHWERSGVAPALSFNLGGKTTLSLHTDYQNIRAPGNVTSMIYQSKKVWEFYRAGGQYPSTLQWAPSDATPLLSPRRTVGFLGGYRHDIIREGELTLVHKFSPDLIFHQAFRADNIGERYLRWNTSAIAKANPADVNDRLAAVGFLDTSTKSESFRTQGDLFYKRDITDWLSTKTLLGYEFYSNSSSSVQYSVGTVGFQSLYNPTYTEVTIAQAEALSALSANALGKDHGNGYFFNEELGLFRNRLMVLFGARTDVNLPTSFNRRTNVLTATARSRTSAPRAALTYKPRDWLSLYALYSVQTNPATISARYTLIDDASDPRLRETISGTPKGVLKEVGAKANLFNDALTVSVAYFDQKLNGSVNNIALYQTLPSGAIDQYNQNYIGTGQFTRGVEFEAFGQLGRRITFTASVYYKVDSVFPVPGTNLTATASANNSENPDTASIFGKYSFTDAQNNGWSVTLGSKAWFGGWLFGYGQPVASTPTLVNKVYYDRTQIKLDLGTSYQWKNGKYAVRAQVNNVFNSLILLNVNQQWELRRAYLSFQTTF